MKKRFCLSARAANRFPRALRGFLLAAWLLVGTAAQATSAAAPETHPTTRSVDLVIALDVSGSMSGLLNSARQRLWDIVNDLGSASPQPDLRVAVISFGSPSYSAEEGYVRLDQPFTRDLDRVNQTLFAFQTNGGDEYVARAIDTAVKRLDWSHDADALRMLFVAGNEGAEQDPLISVESAVRTALDRDIVVNTIYCGGPLDSDARGWADVATLSEGVFASIDQSAAAVANVATPVDDTLLSLNEQLNDTYVAFGAGGEEGRKNQQAQDANAYGMSAPAAASRVAAKAGSFYRAENWDLVDAVAGGTSLEEVAEAELPEPMREMNLEQRADYLKEKQDKRLQLKQEIADLNRERQQFIAEEKAKRDDAEGLDDAIRSGLRAAAEKKGFAFEEEG
ncbi:MAG: vWA domain-containing protein [Pseudomonadota bacterium]